MKSVPPTIFEQCFAAGTPIRLADGSTKPIERVLVGDQVAAFDEHAGAPSAPLIPKRVLRLFENVTDEWIVLSNGLTVTPGHHFLTVGGRFVAIERILDLGLPIVGEDGGLLDVTGERIRHSAGTAHLFEEAEAVRWATNGNAALAPEVVRGWRTYNFEVAEFHTYVAGGVRVHNVSYFGFTTGTASVINGVVVHDTYWYKGVAPSTGLQTTHSDGTLDGGFTNTADRAGDPSLIEGGYTMSSTGNYTIPNESSTLDRMSYGGGDFDQVSAVGPHGDQEYESGVVTDSFGNVKGTNDYGTGGDTNTIGSEVKPLIVDLDGDGVEIAGLGEGAMFDMDGDGWKEPTAWIGTDDGFIVLDAPAGARKYMPAGIVFTRIAVDSLETSVRH